MEQLQSRIWLTASSYMGIYFRISSYILGSPSSYMTLQLLHSELPYIWGKFDFLFYQCSVANFWQTFRPFGAFHERENCSEFRSVKQKSEQTSGILFRNLSSKKNRFKFCMLTVLTPPPNDVKSNLYKFLDITGSVLRYRRKLFCGIPFRASELVLPRTFEWLEMSTFFCGKNKNRSESIPGNFFGTTSGANPTSSSPPMF